MYMIVLTSGERVHVVAAHVASVEQIPGSAEYVVAMVNGMTYRTTTETADKFVTWLGQHLGVV